MQEFKLEALLEYSKIKRSTFYYHLKNQNKNDKYMEIQSEITQIYHENKGRYGYRRIYLELKNRGFSIVLKLMKKLGLQCFVRAKKYKSYKGTIGKIYKNELNRDFKANRPNLKWVTDVTEFKVKGDKIYLSPIVDLYNGEVISYNISTSPNFEQIVDMLDKAFNEIKDLKGLILHSDQGWQYQMKQYQGMLKDKEIVQSMSRKGNCLDNSLAENFFRILKSELFYTKEYTSLDELREEIIEYIDYYNNKRIKSKLKVSPVNYRTHLNQVA